MGIGTIGAIRRIRKRSSGVAKNGDDGERDKTIMAIGRSSLLAYFREEILEECCMCCSHYQCYVMIYYMIDVCWFMTTPILPSATHPLPLLIGLPSSATRLSADTVPLPLANDAHTLPTRP